MQSGCDESVSPVTEVFLYEQKESIRNAIAWRRNDRLANLSAVNTTTTPQTTAAAAPINLVSDESDSGDTTFDYDTPAPTMVADATTTAPSNHNATAFSHVPIATPVATAPAPNSDLRATTITQSVVSATLLELFERLRRNGFTDELEGAPCRAANCPYCSGPLMSQRYELAKRMLQLEKRLFGV